MSTVSSTPGLTDNGGRRCGFITRQITYSAYLPERRKNIERRSGRDRRVDMAQRVKMAQSDNAAIHSSM